MSQVRIIYLKEIELRGGGVRRPREIESVSFLDAETLVRRGSACYYSDFSESMLSGGAGSRKVRVAEPSENAAETTEAPQGEEVVEVSEPSENAKASKGKKRGA